MAKTNNIIVVKNNEPASPEASTVTQDPVPEYYPKKVIGANAVTATRLGSGSDPLKYKPPHLTPHFASFVEPNAKKPESKPEPKSLERPKA